MVQPGVPIYPQPIYEEGPVVPAPFTPSGSGSDSGSFESRDRDQPIIIPPPIPHVGAPGIPVPGVQGGPIPILPPAHGPIIVGPGPHPGSPPGQRLHEDLASPVSPRSPERRYGGSRSESPRGRSRSRLPVVVHVHSTEPRPGSPRHPSAPRTEIASPPPGVVTTHPPIIIQPAGQQYMPGQPVPMVPVGQQMQPPPQVINIQEPSVPPRSPSREQYSEYHPDEPSVRIITSPRSHSRSPEGRRHRTPSPPPALPAQPIIVQPGAPPTAPAVMVPGVPGGPPMVLHTGPSGAEEHPSEIIIRTAPSRGRSPSPRPSRRRDRPESPEGRRRSFSGSPDRYGRRRRYIRSPGGRIYGRLPDQGDPYSRGRRYPEDPHRRSSRSQSPVRPPREYTTSPPSRGWDGRDPYREDYPGPSTAHSPRRPRPSVRYDHGESPRTRYVSRSPSPVVVHVRGSPPQLSRVLTGSPTYDDRPRHVRGPSSRTIRRISRSPSPVYLPHRPQRSAQPSAPDYDRDRRMTPSPGAYSPPPRPIHGLTEEPRSPTVVDFETHPPVVSPEVVRVPTGTSRRVTPGRDISGRGPSAGSVDTLSVPDSVLTIILVTVAPEYDDGTPPQAGE